MSRPRPLVLHVAPVLWSGAGSVITSLCEAQRRTRRVAIVTAGLRGTEADWPAYRRRLRAAGVEHHAIDLFHREVFWASATRLADVLGELRPSVVHAHAGVPACAAVVARDMAGLRTKVLGQMYSWGPDRPEWMNLQDTWGFARADRVVCSAYAYRDLLLRYGVPKRKLVYLPWGLPLEDLPFRGSGVRPGAADAPRIGFVGRIEPRKGQLALVEAFARVRAVRNGARLELVGPIADGAYASRVTAAIARHGIQGSVRLSGRVRDAAARASRWDLFVSLSSDEGQGLAVLEAMALGVPVLARPVAGISDFLADGRTGLAVTDISPADVAGAILDALAHPSRLTGIVRRARRLVERRYDWSRTVEAFERLY